MNFSDRVPLLPQLDVSRETYQRLRDFGGLVEKWTISINLVSPASVPTLWLRHILDSAQLFKLVTKRTNHWADLGSGGGFPGIVVAILGIDSAMIDTVTLVESDGRKAVFLRSVARALDLPVRVITGRVETVLPLSADIVSARALCPLPQLLGHVGRHLSPTGFAVLPKGRNAAQEIAAARTDWRFDLVAMPSMTDAQSQILRIENIVHV